MQESTEVRSRTQTVLLAADLPVVDREFLGERGIALCRHAPVFSAHRLDDSYRSYNSTSLCLDYSPIHTADAIHLDSCVASASAVCIELGISFQRTLVTCRSSGDRPITKTKEWQKRRIVQRSFKVIHLVTSRFFVYDVAIGIRSALSTAPH